MWNFFTDLVHQFPIVVFLVGALFILLASSKLTLGKDQSISIDSNWARGVLIIFGAIFCLSALGLHMKSGNTITAASEQMSNTTTLSSPVKEANKDTKRDSGLPEIEILFRASTETPDQLISRLRSLHRVRALLDLEDARGISELPENIYGFMPYPYRGKPIGDFDSLHRFEDKDLVVEVHKIKREPFLVAFLTSEAAVNVNSAKTLAVYPRAWERAKDAVAAIPNSRIKEIWPRHIKTNKKESILVLDLTFKNGK